MDFIIQLHFLYLKNKYTAVSYTHLDVYKRQVRADRHAGQDDGAGTNPNIVADMNGMRVLQPLQPLPNIHRVFFHDDADAGGDKHVVADGYFSAVHELAVDIEEEVIAHRGVISVGAKEGLLHNTVVSALPSSPRMAACRAPQSSGCIWSVSYTHLAIEPLRRSFSPVCA